MSLDALMCCFPLSMLVPACFLLLTWLKHFQRLPIALSLAAAELELDRRKRPGMPTLEDVAQFVREQTSYRGDITATTTLRDDIGFNGDDTFMVTAMVPTSGIKARK